MGKKRYAVHHRRAGTPAAWPISGLALLLLACAGGANAGPVAAEQCKVDREFQTTRGLLQRAHCKGTAKRETDRWSLNGVQLFEGPYPVSDDAADEQGRLHVFSGGPSPSTGCSDQLFLLDLSEAKPRVFRFGVRNACNDYHWASWGKQRSVIAIRNNVRFVYANGRLTPPRHDVTLMEKLQFSAYGGSNVFEEIVPFAEEITPATPGR